MNVSIETKNGQSLYHSNVVKKSKAVPATFVAAVAVVMLAGCQTQRQVRRCVDEKTGQVLPDSYCGSTYVRRGGIMPIWGYGGSYNGRNLTNFSRTPSASADVVSSSGTVIQRATRGGFGSSGRSFGSSFS